MNYLDYYTNQAGGGSGTPVIYTAPYYQKGYGLGGIFRRFFRWAIPLIKPALSTIGHQAITSASDIAKDVIKGRNFKESAEQHINTSIDNLKEKAERHLQGKGIKRKRKKEKFIIFKKRKTNDIFD